MVYLRRYAYRHTINLHGKIVARIVLPVFHFRKFSYLLFSLAEKQVKKYDLDKCNKVKWNYGAFQEVYEKGLVHAF